MTFSGPPSPIELSGGSLIRPTGGGPAGPNVFGLKLLRQQLQTVRNSLVILADQKKRARAEVARLKKVDNPSLGTVRALAAAEKQLADITKKESAALRRQSALRASIRAEEKGGTPPGGGNGGGGGDDTPAPLQTDTTAKVNLSACKELYFRGESGFQTAFRDIPANAPGNPAAFNQYLADTTWGTSEALWKKGVATKGRIQTFIPPKGGNRDSKPTPELVTGGTAKARGRKMFQFHYNPGSVSLSYGSVSGIDLGLIVSSEPLSNTYSALGSIQFELLVNRMPDMKFINPKETSFRKKDVNYLEIYDRTPITTGGGRANELQAIYNKGTMYDIEFLLKILMGGVSYTSWLRGGELTSDLGFAIPQPVELHLGNRMRYVVSVTNLSLKHVIFNDRMVPLFTTLSITANRIPADAIGSANTDLTESTFTSGGN